MVLNAMVHKLQFKHSLVSGPMVRHRVTVWVIVSVWVSFRVGFWARFRIRVRMRARVDVQVSVCFWGATLESLNHAWTRPRTQYV